MMHTEKSRTEAAVRTVCLILLFIFISSFFFLMIPFETSQKGIDAAEYREPNIRVALALRDAGLRSYTFSTETAFRYGYINKNTDEFYYVNTSGYAYGKVKSDDCFYVEISSYSENGVSYPLTDSKSVSGLNEVISGLGLSLINAYHDGFCYRLGPFDSSSDALPCFDRISRKITEMNEAGAALDIRYSIAAPSSTSVIYMSQGGAYIYSFATSDDTYAMAVEPVQSGDKVVSTLANSYYYPGIIEFRRLKNQDYDSLIVVNTLPLETYVGCVNSCEIYPEWPIETQKIFSVIVRTFTVRSGTKHGSSSADLCNDICCQVYRGLNKVNDKIEQAVNETRGIVLSYGNQIAKVYYAAVGGGSTVSYADAWGDEVPYLQAVAAPWETYNNLQRYTSRARWHVEYTGEEIYKLLKKSGKHSNIMGEVTTVHIDEFCENSCYVYKVTFTDIYGNTSTATCSDTIRYLLDFNSGNFVVGKNGETVQYPEYSLDNYPSIYSDTQNGYGEYLPISEADLRAILKDGTVSGLDIKTCSAILGNGQLLSGLDNENLTVLRSLSPIHLNKQGLPDILNGKTVLTMREMTLSGEEGKFIFEGRGWGHGIGFSQYGIWNLTSVGYDFETVLKYYLKNVEFSNLNDLGY